MQQTIDIIKVTLRVMTAVSQKQQPDSLDVKTLRGYLGTGGPSDLDALACEVFEKALSAARTKIRQRA